MRKSETPVESSRQSKAHWSNITEAGTLLGLRFLWLVYRLMGRRMVSILMRPAVYYFAFFRPVARKASFEFLQTHYQKYPQFWDKPPRFRDVLRHFREFAETVVDKLLSWCISIDADEFDVADPQVIERLMQDQRGQLIIGTHMGNLEYCRGYMHRYQEKVINVLLYDRHAGNYVEVMRRLNPESRMNVFQVDEFDVATILTIRQKIDAGEWVFIAGDRTPLSGLERTVSVDFLGRQAALPIGPYLLAKALQCPVKLMFSYKNYTQGDLRVNFEVVEFSDKVTFNARNRAETIQTLAQDFARHMERHCRRAPFQWFNFYPFWLRGQDNQKQLRSPS